MSLANGRKEIAETGAPRLLVAAGSQRILLQSRQAWVPEVGIATIAWIAFACLLHNARAPCRARYQLYMHKQ